MSERTKALLLLARFNELHQELYDFVSPTSEAASRVTIDEETMVDVGYLCRRISEVSEECRKDARRLSDLCGKVLAVQAATEAVTTGEIKPIRAQFASAHPDSRQVPKVPKLGTPEYGELMDALGVDQSLTKNGVLKVSYGGLQRHVGDLLAAGRNLPGGVTKTWSEFFCKFVVRRTFDYTEEVEKARSN